MRKIAQETEFEKSPLINKEIIDNIIKPSLIASLFGGSGGAFYSLLFDDITTEKFLRNILTGGLGAGGLTALGLSLRPIYLKNSENEIINEIIKPSLLMALLGVSGGAASSLFDNNFTIKRFLRNMLIGGASAGGLTALGKLALKAYSDLNKLNATKEKYDATVDAVREQLATGKSPNEIRGNLGQNSGLPPSLVDKAVREALSKGPKEESWPSKVIKYVGAPYGIGYVAGQGITAYRNMNPDIFQERLVWLKPTSSNTRTSLSSLGQNIITEYQHGEISRDARQLLKDYLGEGLSARAKNLHRYVFGFERDINNLRRYHDDLQQQKTQIQNQIQQLQGQAEQAAQQTALQGKLKSIERNIDAANDALRVLSHVHVNYDARKQLHPKTSLPKVLGVLSVLAPYAWSRLAPELGDLIRPDYSQLPKEPTTTPQTKKSK